ncbi:MAG TPA: VOC family protein [Thermoanaerobaculia bacterium]|nr:VOC family protein [Thermoanaerobaculia bacterium]
MPTVTSHQPGSFCWVELSTNDGAAARKFYSELFGWTTRDVPISDGEVYTIFQNGGRDAAAMYAGNQGSGAPPNWMSYVAVENTDEAVIRAKELGGSVLAEPMDVLDSGRMAVLMDNQGGVFSVWQANQHIGVGVRDELNALCWNELQARDLDAAKRFYPPLFGWRMKESEEYTEWHLGENAVGGAMTSNAPPEVPSFWIPYFAVDDCDSTAQKAQALGGSVHVPCTDIERVGRFSVLVDPTGAAFSVIKTMM